MKSITKRKANVIRTAYLDSLAVLAAEVLAHHEELGTDPYSVKSNLRDIPTEGLRQFVVNRMDGTEWTGSSKLSKEDLVGTIVENWWVPGDKT